MASVRVTGFEYFKSALIGMFGSLIMFSIMEPLILLDIAPFNTSPSEAFLTALGLSSPLLALALHFLYGAFWSVVFVKIFKESTSMGKGFIFSILLWLILMLIYSPITGWGVFGLADTSDLPRALQLSSSGAFMLSTLVLHLIYGFLIGYLNPAWLDLKLDTAQDY